MQISLDTLDIVKLPDPVTRYVCAGVDQLV